LKPLRISKNNTIILRILALSFFLFGLIFVSPIESLAGFPQSESDHRIAISVHQSDYSSFTPERLEQVREIGIDLLEISFPNSIPTSSLNQFYLLLDSEVHFTTEHQLSTEYESIYNSVLLTYNSVPTQLRQNVAAIKVFDYPADYRSSFPASSDSLLLQLTTSIDKPLYYQSGFSVPGFPVQQVDFFAGKITVQPDSMIDISSAVVRFEPSKNPVETLQALERVLNQSLNETESLILIPAEWFLNRLESQASFSTIISSYLNGEPVDFPMPAETTESPVPNWPIILLLLIWGSFIIHYKFQPTYKATLPRYFFYHSFFVHDVKQQRIRNITPGVVILLQFAIITGFLFYLLADGFISDVGLQSLSYHYSLLFYPGYEELSIFVIGVFTALISHIICIAWLYFPNKRLKQLNQVINLYCWPLHINLVVVTAALYFVQIQAAPNWTIAIAIIYFFFWFSSFVTAAVDSAQFLDKMRALNLFLTIGLYFLLVISLFLSALWLPGIYQPLEMAFILP
jgi:hypothetical protein